MKHLLFFLLFLPVLAYAQFPNAPNKIRLGNQTTADGLVVRTAAAPSWTPSSVNNAWLAFDTVAAVLYYYDAATWNPFTSGGGGITSVTVSNDTLSIVTADSTFIAVFDDANTNFANTNLTFTGNRVHNLNDKNLIINDAGTYPTLYIFPSTDGIGMSATLNDYVSASANYVEVRSAGQLPITATDTVAITAGRIRINAADTRVQQVPNDNALNRLMALDSLTGRLYYVDKSSIAGGGGTVTGTGTTNTIPVWSSSTALGDSPLTVASGNVTATGTGAFRLPNGTDAQRPGTPTAGMTRYSTTNGTNEWYGASAWERGVRSASATGLGTASRLARFDVNGRLASDYVSRIDPSIYLVSIGGASASVTGSGNNFFGQNAGVANTSGANNNFFGAFSGSSNTTGINNNFFGTVTGLLNTTGINNNYFGDEAGRLGTTASYNNFFGTNAGRSNISGSGNIGIGRDALNNATATDTLTGSNNIGIGTSVARNIRFGAAGNVAIGNSIDLPTADGANQIVIKNVIFGTGASGTGTTVASGARIGINESAPSRTLHVTGEARITDLTTDAPTRIVGADADGDLGEITIGSGLSLSGSSLTASNLYNANGTLTGARTVTLGNNTLTFSGTSGAPSGVNFSMAPSTNTQTLQSLDGSLNNSVISITPSRTQIVTTNVTGGTAAAFEVFADSVTISPTPVSANNTITRILGQTASGRIQHVHRDSITGKTDLSFSGISSVFSLNSSTGNDVHFRAGNNLLLFRSGDTLTVSHFPGQYSLSVSGGSTFFGTTFERPDNDTPGTAAGDGTTAYTSSGSTVDYVGDPGVRVSVNGSISFSISDDVDVYISMFREGTEISETSTRITCQAGNYYTVTLPKATVVAGANDTFDLRIRTQTGNSTTTMHRYGFTIETNY